MRAVYFDCFSGISGDMMLGALIDLGANPEKLLENLRKLDVRGYDIIIEKKESCGIVATDVKVILLNENEVEYGHNHNNSHNHHDNSHNHGHNHNHGRNLSDIESIIDASSLTERVKYLSKNIFREIAKAEAKVHNKDICEVHFHEVGALDSIVDVVGVCICLELLGVEAVFSSPLKEGTGFINCQHGTLPVPVPAVMEMLKGSGIPVETQMINTELVTPTGIGIIKTLSRGFGLMPKMYVEGVGYGLGKRDTGRFNALRAVVGSLFEEEILSNDVFLLEANIDDLAPQILGYTLDTLLENGALDVFFTPIYMKKNRPAQKLSVICEVKDEKKMADLIFRETSTIGIRKSRMERMVMERSIKTVETEYGPIRFKESKWGDTLRITPEYEDAKEIARQKGLPLIDVMRNINCRTN